MLADYRSVLFDKYQRKKGTFDHLNKMFFRQVACRVCTSSKVKKQMYNVTSSKVKLICTRYLISGARYIKSGTGDWVLDIPSATVSDDFKLLIVVR